MADFYALTQHCNNIKHKGSPFSTILLDTFSNHVFLHECLLMLAQEESLDSIVSVALGTPVCGAMLAFCIGHYKSVDFVTMKFFEISDLFCASVTEMKPSSAYVAKLLKQSAETNKFWTLILFCKVAPLLTAHDAFFVEFDVLRVPPKASLPSELTLASIWSLSETFVDWLLLNATTQYDFGAQNLLDLVFYCAETLKEPLVGLYFCIHQMPFLCQNADYIDLVSRIFTNGVIRQTSWHDAAALRVEMHLHDWDSFELRLKNHRRFLPPFSRKQMNDFGALFEAVLAADTSIERISANVVNLTSLLRTSQKKYDPSLDAAFKTISAALFDATKISALSPFECMQIIKNFHKRTIFQAQTLCIPEKIIFNHLKEQQCTSLHVLYYVLSFNSALVKIGSKNELSDKIIPYSDDLLALIPFDCCDVNTHPVEYFELRKLIDQFYPDVFECSSSRKTQMHSTISKFEDLLLFTASESVIEEWMSYYSKWPIRSINESCSFFTTGKSRQINARRRAAFLAQYVDLDIFVKNVRLIDVFVHTLHCCLRRSVQSYRNEFKRHLHGASKANGVEKSQLEVLLEVQNCVVVHNMLKLLQRFYNNTKVVASVCRFLQKLFIEHSSLMQHIFLHPFSIEVAKCMIDHIPAVAAWIKVLPDLLRKSPSFAVPVALAVAKKYPHQKSAKMCVNILDYFLLSMKNAADESFESRTIPDAQTIIEWLDGCCEMHDIFPHLKVEIIKFLADVRSKLEFYTRFKQSSFASTQTKQYLKVIETAEDTFIKINV